MWGAQAHICRSVFYLTGPFESLFANNLSGGVDWQALLLALSILSGVPAGDQGTFLGKPPGGGLPLWAFPDVADGAEDDLPFPPLCAGPQVRGHVLFLPALAVLTQMLLEVRRGFSWFPAQKPGEIWRRRAISPCFTTQCAGV